MASSMGKCTVWLLSVAVVLVALWTVAHASTCYRSSYSYYCKNGCCSSYSSYSGYYSHCCSASSTGDMLYVGIGVAVVVIVVVVVGIFLCVKHFKVKQGRSGTVRPSRTAAAKPTVHPVPLGTTVHARVHGTEYCNVSYVLKECEHGCCEKWPETKCCEWNYWWIIHLAIWGGLAVIALVITVVVGIVICCKKKTVTQGRVLQQPGAVTGTIWASPPPPYSLSVQSSHPVTSYPSPSYPQPRHLQPLSTSAFAGEKDVGAT